MESWAQLTKRMTYKFFLRFPAAFTKPENKAGVPFEIFLYDAP